MGVMAPIFRDVEGELLKQMFGKNCVQFCTNFVKLILR